MEFLRPKRPGLSLDMTPMIDIVFQLLIFFMLASSFLSPSLKMTLPKASAQQNKPEPENLIISVDRKGDVFLNTIPVPMAELKTKIERNLAENNLKSVHLRGDSEMPYKLFVQVMDLARQAGAVQINIVHDRESSP